MRPQRLALALIAFYCTLPAIALETKHHALITPIIEAFASNDVEAIARHIQFPHQSTYPIPPINETNFAQRFDEIIDAELIKTIAQSDINSDWSKVGWHGIMLDNGTIWVDHEGKICAINHTTQTSTQVRKALIAADKATLQKSLRQFERPILKWTTALHVIRIDALEDGHYRYIQWKKQAIRNDTPELILTCEEPQFEGSGGNHYYEFNHSDTAIRCDIIRLGVDDTPGYITILKEGVEIEQANVLKSE